MKFARVGILMIVCLIAMPLSSLYASEQSTVGSVGKFEGYGRQNHLPEWLQRFRPYELNYAIWQLSQSDADAMEVQYSFKYQILDHDKSNVHTHDLYLSYTGKFDFYMGTRDSGPVINRTSNPALHYRYNFSSNNIWIDSAVEHRSNGQVTDVKDKDTNPTSSTFGQYLTEIEYRKGNREYFDGISRGANYISISPGVEYAEDSKAELQCKIYFSDDSDITWGKYAGTGTDFADFDLFRLKASHIQRFGKDNFRDVTLGVEYLIGKKGLATDSIDVYIVIPWYSTSGDWKLPVIVKSHFGPMDRLSNYTQSISTVGLGLALSY